MMRLDGLCALAVSLLALGACSTGASAMLETARQLYGGSSAASAPALNPQYSYLRAFIAGREAYLALGYIDSLPQGPTEVWYSGTGEVVRIRNGRIVGTTGLTTDWRAVRFSAEPAWSAHSPSSTASATAAAATQFSRERDLMPGYRMGVRDTVQQIAIAAPSSTHMLRAHGGDLRWFEERSTTLPPAAALPPARFAVAEVDGRAQVVYSEQCVTRELCLSLERWVPAPAAASPTAEPAASQGS